MVILGLGSNLGNRIGYIKQAINILSAKNILKNIVISPVYESEAITLEDALDEWKDCKYLNLVIKGETDYLPYDLLQELKDIEKAIGRKYRGRWAPREIDIDILIYDDIIIEDENLIIPHKLMTERIFVMKPLADIEPEYLYHKEGQNFKKSFLELSENLEKNDKNKITIFLENIE